MGNRVATKVYNSDGNLQEATYFINNNRGDVICSYYLNSTGTLETIEQIIFGIKRIGLRLDSIETTLDYSDIGTFHSIRGKKRFELSNHLGSINEIISDHKIANNGTTFILDYSSVIYQYSDYSAFGIALNSDSSINDRFWGNYRFGFQAQSHLDELDQTGIIWDYEYRIHNAQLGRFFAVDPLNSSFPWNSPYAFSENKVIQYVELEGLESSEPSPPEGSDAKPAIGNVTYSIINIPGQEKPIYLKRTLEKVDSPGDGPINPESWTQLQQTYEFVDEIPVGQLAEYNPEAVVQNPGPYAIFGGSELINAIPRIEPLEDGSVGEYFMTFLGDNDGTRYVDGVGYNTEGYPIGLDNRPTTGTAPTPSVHGNSLNSLRPTWGYKLYSKKDGTFLKNGITSQPDYLKRYSKKFLRDKRMDAIHQFSNRREAYDWEYQQNLILRGLLNKNMH